jgi:microcystin-dependent protein
MLQIEAASIVSGHVDSFGVLILTANDGTEIPAGFVTGEKGDPGVPGAPATALLTATDTATIDISLSGSGTPADPWVLSADFKGSAGTVTYIARQVGEVFFWLGSTVPTGCLKLEGQTVSRTTYADLFAAWGTTYGAGDGSTTFGLPDMRGRVPVGLDGSADFTSLGKIGGEKTHLLTAAESGLRSHRHAIPMGSTVTTNSYDDYAVRGAGGTPDSGFRTGTPKALTSAFGSNGWGSADMADVPALNAHNILQPYLTGYWVVKALYTASEVSPIAPPMTPIVARTVGEMYLWAGAVCPDGGLWAEGQAVSRTLYADLFSKIGTTYGAGDGTTTFNVPDMRGKVPVGYDSTQTEFNAIAKTGGQKTTNHGFYVPGINSGSMQASGDAYEVADIAALNSFLTAGGSSAATKAVSVQAVGGSVIGTGTGNTEVRHYRYTSPNLQPYVALRWVIKAAYTGSEIGPGTSHVHAIADVTGLQTQVDLIASLQTQLNALSNGVDIVVTPVATYINTIAGTAKVFGKHVVLTLQLKFKVVANAFVAFATIPVAYGPVLAYGAGSWGIAHGIVRNETRGGTGYARVVNDGGNCYLAFGDGGLTNIQANDNVAFTVAYAI